MPDQDLRSLERRWRETGAIEDEARFLVARVRAGELTDEQLALAGYCGHPAALVAVDSGPAPPLWAWAWTKGLQRWGHEALSRAAVAATRRALDFWERSYDDARPRVALEAAERWIVDGTLEAALTAREATAASARAAEEHEGVSEGKVAHAAACCSRLPVDAQLAACEAVHSADEVCDALDSARHEVAAWALGVDPVEERVRARSAPAPDERP